MVLPPPRLFGKSTIQYLGGQKPDNSNRRWLSIAEQNDSTRDSPEIFSEMDKGIFPQRPASGRKKAGDRSVIPLLFLHPMVKG